MRNLASAHFYGVMLLFVLCIRAVVIAQDPIDDRSFAMDTKVLDAEDQVVMTTTTVFEGLRVYDVFGGDSSQAARFDLNRQVVDFVDRQQRTRAQVTFAEILQFQAELITMAQRRKGLGVFLAQPTFIEEYDASESKIKLSSPWFSYEADVVQATADITEQLASFADWSARVAGMLAPAAPPASARLELNRALKKANWQATRIVRRAGPNAPHFSTLQSIHHFRPTISQQDRTLIDGVEKDLSEFQSMSFSEFRRATESTQRVTKK